MAVNIPELRKYIAGAGSRRFAWGELDCCLFVADWVDRSCGIDPAAGWRGEDSSAAEARRRARCGFEAAMIDAMDMAGFARTEHPLPGDVAVVNGPIVGRSGRVRVHPVGAIRTGRIWSVKTMLGVVGAPFEVVAAWTIPMVEAR